MYEDILVKSKKKKEKKKSSNVEVTLRYLPRSLSKKKKKKINQGRTEIGQVSKVLWKTLK